MTNSRNKFVGSNPMANKRRLYVKACIGPVHARNRPNTVYGIINDGKIRFNRQSVGQKKSPVTNYRTLSTARFQKQLHATTHSKGNLTGIGCHIYSHA